MKKSMKIFSVLLMVMLLVSFMASNVFGQTPSSVITDIEGKVNASTVNIEGDIVTKIGDIIKLIRNASAIIAVVLVVIIGVKYMMSSLEQKAELKKSFVPLIIGIVLVVSATSIASFLFSIVG